MGIALAYPTLTTSECTTFNIYSVLFQLGIALYIMFNISSFGNAIDDIWDKDIDSKIERTKNRPVASNKLSVTEAGIFTAIHLALGIHGFTLLNLNAPAISIIAGSIAMIVIYPTFKRFTYYPAVWFGIYTSSPILVMYVNISNTFDLQLILIYLSNFLWVVLQEAICGAQVIN